MKSLITMLLLFLATSTQAGELTLRVTGLFSKDRVNDLRRAVEKIERVQLKGVARATASFKNGKVTALIDPQETNRLALEEALKKKGVALKSTESK
jgi:hypothetical protein